MKKASTHAHNIRNVCKHVHAYKHFISLNTLVSQDIRTYIQAAQKLPGSRRSLLMINRISVLSNKLLNAAETLCKEVG